MKKVSQRSDKKPTNMIYEHYEINSITHRETIQDLVHRDSDCGLYGGVAR